MALVYKTMLIICSIWLWEPELRSLYLHLSYVSCPLDSRSSGCSYPRFSVSRSHTRCHVRSNSFGRCSLLLRKVRGGVQSGPSNNLHLAMHLRKLLWVIPL